MYVYINTCHRGCNEISLKETSYVQRQLATSIRANKVELQGLTQGRVQPGYVGSAIVIVNVLLYTVDDYLVPICFLWTIRNPDEPLR